MSTEAGRSPVVWCTWRVTCVCVCHQSVVSALFFFSPAAMSRYRAAMEHMRVYVSSDDDDSDDDVSDVSDGSLAASEAASEASEASGSEEQDADAVPEKEKEKEKDGALPAAKEIIAGRYSCTLCPKKYFVTTEDLMAHLGSKGHAKAERKAAGLLPTAAAEADAAKQKQRQMKKKALTPEQVGVGGGCCC